MRSSFGRDMKIQSEDHSCTLTIESCGAELAAYPSICVSVDLSTPLASGAHGEVWLDLPAIEAFLHASEELDTKRTGSASLEAMSPDDLRLILCPLDSRGHLSITVSISGSRYSGSHPMKYSVESAFEIDPTSIFQIVSGFKRLIQEQKVAEPVRPANAAKLRG